MVKFITFAGIPLELSKELSEGTITFMIIVHTTKKIIVYYVFYSGQKQILAGALQKWLL